MGYVTAQTIAGAFRSVAQTLQSGIFGDNKNFLPAVVAFILASPNTSQSCALTPGRWRLRKVIDAGFSREVSVDTNGEDLPQERPQIWLAADWAEQIKAGLGNDKLLSLPALGICFRWRAPFQNNEVFLSKFKEQLGHWARDIEKFCDEGFEREFQNQELFVNDTPATFDAVLDALFSPRNRSENGDNIDVRGLGFSRSGRVETHKTNSGEPKKGCISYGWANTLLPPWMSICAPISLHRAIPTPSTPNASDATKTELLAILRELAVSKQVLIKGPPATGKTHMLALVAWAFRQPAAELRSFFSLANNEELKLPWAKLEAANRTVIPTAFHSNTKYKDFVGGLAPKTGGESVTFSFVEGPLLQAINRAATPESACLLLIDEINRGPTAAIFGDAMVAIEKRGTYSQIQPSDSFPITIGGVEPCDGFKLERYVTPNVYLLGAMNEADVSIQAMDLALLRRFSPYDFYPEPSVAEELLKETFDKLKDESALNSGDFDRALRLIKAWDVINRRICDLRGNAYELGHGIFRSHPGDTFAEYIIRVWKHIDSHVRELFYGDVNGAASVLIGGFKDYPKSPSEQPYVVRPLPTEPRCRGKFIGICTFHPNRRWTEQKVEIAVKTSYATD